MPKDRPIKSYRLEGERPFKTYNPGISPSLLSANARRLDQQASLPTIASSLMEQQQLRQRHQHMSNQLSQPPERTYSNQMEYLRIRNQLQPGHHENTVIGADLTSYEFSDVTLDDTNNQLTRPEPVGSNNAHIHQGNIDINAAPSNSNSVHSNFMVPNRSSYRTSTVGSMAEQDPFSMLFEHPMTFVGSGQPRSMDNMVAMGYNPLAANQLPEGRSTPFNSLTTYANALGRPVRGLTFSANTDNLPVKQEFHEGNFNMTERPHSSINQTEGSRESFNHSLKYSPDFSTSTCSMSSPETVEDKTTPPRPYQNDSNDDKSQGETTSKDQTYMEKRRKNNESAKRSREARRTKEELVALRVIGLEEENMKLHAEIHLLDKELEDLRARICQGN